MKRIVEKIIGLPINIVTLGYYRSVNVATHHYMVDRYAKRNSSFYSKIIKSNFLKFKKAFEKINWETSEIFKESLFSHKEKSEFHASIICINGVGYKLTTYGLIRANRLKNKKIKELNKK